MSWTFCSGNGSNRFPIQIGFNIFFCRRINILIFIYSLPNVSQCAIKFRYRNNPSIIKHDFPFVWKKPKTNWRCVVSDQSFKPISVAAPTEAMVTCAAYFVNVARAYQHDYLYQGFLGLFILARAGIYAIIIE